MYVYLILQTFTLYNYAMENTEVIGIYSSEEKALHKLSEILGVKIDELEIDHCYRKFIGYSDIHITVQKHKLDED